MQHRSSSVQRYIFKKKKRASQLAISLITEFFFLLIIIPIAIYKRYYTIFYKGLFCLQNYFTPTEKIHLQKALEKKSRVRLFSSLHFIRLPRCCRLENPHRSRRASVCVWETGREHLVYVFQFRRCLPLVHRFPHSLLGVLAPSCATGHSCVPE